jgi:hypothetical protein
VAEGTQGTCGNTRTLKEMNQAFHFTVAAIDAMSALARNLPFDSVARHEGNFVIERNHPDLSRQQMMARM